MGWEEEELVDKLKEYKRILNFEEAILPLQKSKILIFKSR